MGTIEPLEKNPGRRSRIEALRKRVTSGLPQFCVERARLVTESYRQTEGEIPVIRRAKALEYILTHMTIGIGEGELIVGNLVETVEGRGVVILPEYSCDWLEDELNTMAKREVDQAFITEEDKRTIRELIPFWKGKTVKEKSFFLMPETLRTKYAEYHGVCNNDRGRGDEGLAHIVVDWERPITRGLDSITREAEARLRELDPGDPVHLAKIHFYRAVIISHKAAIAFAARYAQLARTLGEKEKDNHRKAELKKIAEICEHVPAKPARTFQEAMQSFWFLKIALHMEGWGAAIGPGRADQYFFPYYKKDLEAGTLDREKAKELLLTLYIKLNSAKIFFPLNVARFFAGVSGAQAFMLGGVGRDGRDATNELSTLMLEVDGELSLAQPESIIRINKNTPRDFLMQACRVARTCRGKLKFINDEITVQKMLNQGYAVEDARDYGMVGCHEPFVPRKSHYVPGAHLNLAMCLELALNNGVSVVSGKQLGPRTGDPAAFRSIQDVLSAYRAQVAHFSKHVAEYNSVFLEAHAQVAPTPFQSSLVQGCLEKGLDLTADGALHNACWVSGVGVINVGDSLAAIKKCVFDERKITVEELLAALRDNFEGKEEIRRALAEAPKFGNDDDRVDLLTKEAVSIFCDEWQNVTCRGGMRQPIAALNANTSGIPLGRVVGASADGRKSGEPLADGGVSPAHGRNTRGPAATYKSVAKLDHVKLKCGSVLNMRFNPDALRDEVSIQKFASLLQTYCDLGGYHVQFNIVSGEILREAQANPEKYRDLLVRVSTWTAYFVELGTDVQNDIIRRIEFEEV
jgi:pyruvate formate-lyase/glycerol dehydratase family glycyl radical enzyme